MLVEAGDFLEPREKDCLVEAVVTLRTTARLEGVACEVCNNISPFIPSHSLFLLLVPPGGRSPFEAREQGNSGDTVHRDQLPGHWSGHRGVEKWIWAEP